MIDVPVLEATSFLREFPTGRNKPCVFLCEDDSGKAAEEYVVKLRANLSLGATGHLCELVGTLLASRLGLPVAPPAIVNVSASLADAVVQPDIKQAIQASAGLNFGCLNMVGGFHAYPPRFLVPEILRQQAFEVFAFDALIQNPDRIRDRPNLLYDGNEFCLIDHELAFSFLFSIQRGSPFQLSKLEFLRDHIFYQQLRRTTVETDRIEGEVASLSDADWQAITRRIPDAWKTDKLDQIIAHCTAITRKHDVFFRNLKLRLQ